MESFVGERKNFIVNLRPNWKLKVDWSDVLPGFSVGKNPGSRVLDIPKPFKSFTG